MLEALQASFKQPFLGIHNWPPKGMLRDYTAVPRNKRF